MAHVFSPARLFPYFSNACRCAQSNVSLSWSPEPSSYLCCRCGVQRCFPTAFREVPCWLPAALAGSWLRSCRRRIWGIAWACACSWGGCRAVAALLPAELCSWLQWSCCRLWPSQVCPWLRSAAGSTGPQASQEFIRRCFFCLQPVLLSLLFLLPKNVKFLWLFIGIWLFNLFHDGRLCVCVCV